MKKSVFNRRGDRLGYLCNDPKCFIIHRERPIDKLNEKDYALEYWGKKVRKKDVKK
jgi:hypothetical protein